MSEENFDDYEINLPIEKPVPLPIPKKPIFNVSISGEIEIIVGEALGKQKEHGFRQSELIVGITIKDNFKEGIILLSSAKTKRFLKLLDIKGLDL